MPRRPARDSAPPATLGAAGVRELVPASPGAPGAGRWRLLFRLRGGCRRGERPHPAFPAPEQKRDLLGPRCPPRLCSPRPPPRGPEGGDRCPASEERRCPPASRPGRPLAPAAGSLFTFGGGHGFVDTLGAAGARVVFLKTSSRLWPRVSASRPRAEVGGRRLAAGLAVVYEDFLRSAPVNRIWSPR